MGALFLIFSAIGIFLLGWLRLIVFDSVMMEAAFTFLPAGMVGYVVSAYVENILVGMATALVIFGVILLAIWLSITGQVPSNMDQYIVAQNIGPAWNRTVNTDNYLIKLTNTSNEKIIIDHLTYDVYDCSSYTENVDNCETYPSLGREDFSSNDPNKQFIINPHQSVTIRPTLNKPTFVDIGRVEVDKIGVGAYSIINN